LVQKADVLPGIVAWELREATLRKIDHAIDLARIVRNDSIRNGRQTTAAGGHIGNLESLLRDLRKDIEKENK
jgi:hypothetical protein